MIKVVLGILIGIFTVLIVYFSYRIYYLPDKPITFYQTILDSARTSRTLAIREKLADIKIAEANTDEKLISINKRFDDYLLFGGIVVTLLLGIVATVYFKTEAEVAKNFDEKFGDYQKRIQAAADKVEKLLNSVEAEAEIIQGIRQTLSASQSKTPE
jgi:hypothetical protein